MKIVHKVFNDWTLEQIKILFSLGIHVDKGYDSFDIEEGKIFDIIKTYFDEWGITRTAYGTIYEDSELDNATLLTYTPTWDNGWPQPQEKFGYKKITYFEDSYCKTCGIGKIQQSPFRLKKAPSWGGVKSIFSLYWVLDEVFVRKDIYHTIFEKYGLKTMPVLLYKKESVVEDTLQLIIPKTDAALDMKDFPFEICKTCGRKKYSPKTRGYFPSFKEPVKDMQIFKCQEYFGGGTNAFNRIFVTQEVRQELIKYKAKSAFMPLGDNSFLPKYTYCYPI
jgi:hypothetical protein